MKKRKYSVLPWKVLILPEESPKAFGKIVVPEEFQDNYRFSYGKVLAAGASTEFKAGQTVLFDIDAPAKTDFPGVGRVSVVSDADVKGVVEWEDGKPWLYPTKDRVFFVPLVELEYNGISIPAGSRYNPLLRGRITGITAESAFNIGDVVLIDERYSTDIRTRERGDFMSIREEFLLALVEQSNENVNVVFGS